MAALRRTQTMPSGHSLPAEPSASGLAAAMAYHAQRPAGVSVPPRTFEAAPAGAAAAGFAGPESPTRGGYAAKGGRPPPGPPGSGLLGSASFRAGPAPPPPPPAARGRAADAAAPAATPPRCVGGCCRAAVARDATRGQLRPVSAAAHCTA
jgi:hypothetical protein